MSGWKKSMVLESKKRSWTKSITWRILAVLILAVVAYAITKDPLKTTIITVITIQVPGNLCI